MKAIMTRNGNIPFPAFIPITRLGTRGGIDGLVQPLLASVAGAVMTGYAAPGHKNAADPKLPVMVTTGSSVLLSYGAMAVRRGETGEIHFTAKKTSLTPEKVLEAQESHADVAFTFDFPIPFGLDPIEAFRRQDLTISCALWAMSARKRTDLPLYACVQGWNKQSYRQCANAFKGKKFAGYAVGGLSTRADDIAGLLSIVEGVLEEADGKPVHVFNQGDPRMVAALLNDVGVDSVSSNSWLTLAGDGRFWDNPTARLVKPSPNDKVLLALWNLSCATGRKAATVTAEIAKMMKTE